MQELVIAPLANVYFDRGNCSNNYLKIREKRADLL